MPELKRGTIKREVAKIELREYEVSNIITAALLEKGFDIVSKPIVDVVHGNVGESITIYKVEQK